MIRQPVRFATPLWLSLGAALLLALHGCASTAPPISRVQLSAGETSPPSGSTPAVLVSAVKLPDYLLRDELLLRDDDFSLRYDASRRWAEPLDLGIQRVLAERLESALDSQQLIRAPDVHRRGVRYWTLDIEVRHFEVEGNAVVLSAVGRWTAPQYGSATSTEQAPIFVAFPFDDRLEIDSATEVGIAAAMSRLLWQFAQALAESYETLINQTEQSSER